MITAIVVPVVMSAIMSATRLDETSRRRLDAAVLADSKLRELVVTGDWRDAENTGDFGDDCPQFTWRLETDEWTQDAIAMRELTLSVYATADATTALLTLVTLVPESETTP
jgi:hypothetical protein